MDDGLVCPTCGAAYPGSERFCASCGMPLVPAESDAADRARPLTPARERARKVRPQYTEGPLVRVAGARHQAEAELIQGLLLEEGIPSMLKRSRGFDVPDMLAAGPRDVLVPAAGAEPAREVLLQAELLETREARPAVERPARLLAVLVGVAALFGLIAWVATELLG
jgi:pimeloyl-ACP methyl ester carboxylesterase